MAESALPAMLLSATAPEWVRSLVPGTVRPLRASRRSPVRHARRPVDTSTAIWTPSAPERWSTAWHRVGRTMPPRRVVGPRRAAGRGPGYFKEILDLFLHTDLRPVLESIQAPTPVPAPARDRHVIAQHARDVADRIPNARLVEFDGDDHVWFAGDADRGFSTRSSRSSPEAAEPHPPIAYRPPSCSPISSDPPSAQRLGRSGLATVLDAHDRIVERHVASARGNVVKFTGGAPPWRHLDGPARAIECACAIRDAVQDVGLSIRAGPYTGEVGGDRRRRTASRYIAARIMGLAEPVEVWCRAPFQRWCWGPGSCSRIGAATS